MSRRSADSCHGGSLPEGTRTAVRSLGVALDEDLPLEVNDHGLVALDEYLINQMKDDCNGRQPGRPPTDQGERSASRQGSARGPRDSRAAARVGSDLLRGAYEGQVDRLAQSYPKLRTLSDDRGMWLQASSAIVAGLDREATFLIGLPYTSGWVPKAWAFWVSPSEKLWIGPRHTNFGDGTVCAFSPADRAWSEGGDLMVLMALYSVWALRHLHLEIFGRWPGKQYALTGADPSLQAYYRRAECIADELCGCGSGTRRYADCCQRSDLQWDFLKLASHFVRQIPGGLDSRKPPVAITEFIQGKRPTPPPLSAVYPQGVEPQSLG